MTHKSDFAYGARPLPEPHSGARSGEVRVRYFDPVTGRPCERRPATRTAQLRAARVYAHYLDGRDAKAAAAFEQTMRGLRAPGGAAWPG